MFRSRWISFVAVLVCIAGLFSSHAFAADHPNLLIVFPDQFRAQAMGFMHQEPVHTPNIDHFAGESVVFTQAVSNWPVCSPFRAQLMSGQYPPTNGVYSNCNSRTAPYHCELKTDARCWSDVLHDKGYSLGYIGKWHLESPHKPYVDCYNDRGKVAWNEWTPPDRRHGFDYWYAYNTFDLHLHPMYWSTDAKRDGFHYVNEWGPQHEADKAIEFFKNAGGKYRDANKPFALVVAMNPPHTPYDQVPDRYKKVYADVPIDQFTQRPDIPSPDGKWGKYYRANIRDYYSAITGVDDQFGRILKGLADAGLADNTIVVFASDHGNCVGIHFEQTKANMYEEAMRIPLIIRWPGHLKPRHDDLLISVPDFYPTLLSMMGFADAIPSQVQGVSYAKVIEGGGGAKPDGQLYFHMPYNDVAGGARGIRTDRYKLVIDREGKGGERVFLFDLKNDPYEMHNIASQSPKIVADLRDRLLIPGLKRIHDPWLNTKN